MKNNKLVELGRINEKVRELKRYLAELQEDKSIKDIDSSYSKFCDREIMVSVMGVTKRGKSTLVNALLGREDDEVAPVDTCPVSMVVSGYKYSTQKMVTAFFQNGQQEEISFPEIKSFITVQGNPENEKQVESVLVEGPFAGLEYISSLTNSKIAIYDTPGTESIEENYDNILYNYIPRSDVILYVFTLNQPISPADVSFIKQIRKVKDNKHGLVMVLNKKDLLSKEDLEKAIAYTRNILRNAGVTPLPKIVPISALEAIGNTNQTSFSKLIQALQVEITESSMYESHLRMLATRIVTATHQPVLKLRTSFGFDKPMMENLEKELESLPQDSIKAKEQFEEKWDTAIDRYLNNLEVAQRKINEEVSFKFSHTSFFSGSSQGNLQNAINVIIKSELRACTEEVYGNLKDAFNVLGKNMISAVDRVDTSCTPERTNASPGVYAASVSKTAMGLLLTSGAPAIPALLASAVTSAGSGGFIAGIGGAVGSMIALPLGAILGAIVAPVGLIMAGTGIIRWRKVYKIKQNSDLLRARDSAEKAISDLFRKLEREAHDYRNNKSIILREYEKLIKVESETLRSDLKKYDKIDIEKRQEIHDAILSSIEGILHLANLGNDGKPYDAQ